MAITWSLSSGFRRLLRVEPGHSAKEIAARKAKEAITISVEVSSDALTAVEFWTRLAVRLGNG